MGKKVSTCLLICLLATGLKAQIGVDPEYADLMPLKRIDKMLAKAATAADKAELKKHYYTMVAMVWELHNYRQKFLEKGDMINLFPTAYYHTTMIEMKAIAAGSFAYPIEKLKQMIAFFEAYRVNRTNWDNGLTDNVEPHWQEHFRYAESDDAQSNLFCTRVAYVLGSAIVAHVKFDLPRAIHHAFSNRYDRRITQGSVLIGDFLATDQVFNQSMNSTLADVASVRYCPASVMKYLATNPYSIVDLNNSFYEDNPKMKEYFNLKPIFTAGDVITLRRNAWHQAYTQTSFKGFYNLPLPAQPMLQRSEYYDFGSELMADLYQSPKDLYKRYEFTLRTSGVGPFGTKIMLEEGEYVFILVQGEYVAGQWVGNANGAGLLSSSIVGNMYNKYSGARHACVVALVGEQVLPCQRIFSDVGMKYNVAGVTPDYGSAVEKPFFSINYIPGTYFLAPEAGELMLDLNDTKTSDNNGDLKITIFTMKFREHKNRNLFNLCTSKEPNDAGRDCNGRAWIKEGMKSWYYHGINDSYRGAGDNKGCQCVFDGDDLLTSGENQGSFDIAYWLYNANTQLPEANLMHLILDVIPHDLYEEVQGADMYYPSIKIDCK